MHSRTGGSAVDVLTLMPLTAYVLRILCTVDSFLSPVTAPAKPRTAAHHIVCCHV